MPIIIHSPTSHTGLPCVLQEIVAGSSSYCCGQASLDIVGTKVTCSDGAGPFINDASCSGALTPGTSPALSNASPLPISGTSPTLSKASPSPTFGTSPTLSNASSSPTSSSMCSGGEYYIIPTYRGHMRSFSSILYSAVSDLFSFSPRTLNLLYHTLSA